MPTYQYACTTCDEQIEVVQRFTDDALTDCPACTGRLRKVYSPVGIVFRGSGFYKTDSRGSGRAAGAEKADKGDKKEKPAAQGTSGDAGGSPPASPATSPGSPSTPAASPPPASAPTAASA